MTCCKQRRGEGEAGKGVRRVCKEKDGGVPEMRGREKTDLRVLGEEVVSVDVHRREVPDGLELKGDLYRLLLAAVVLPAHPLVAWSGGRERGG